MTFFLYVCHYYIFSKCPENRFTDDYAEILTYYKVY